MHTLIAAAFARTRTTMLLLVLIFAAGAWSYATIPKEASPEIEIPIFVVSVSYPGISAEDSARLLVEPLERRFQALQGLRSMRAEAGDGFATITLEFDPGFDHATAVQDVRDETDAAGPDLPDGAGAPSVREVDLSQFPILTVGLSGDVPERELIALARGLGDRIEGVSGVLEARLSGDRAELLEIVIDPLAMQSYGLSAEQVGQAVRRNNQLVAAGAFDTGAGRIGVTIPGTIRSLADVLTMPVRVSDGTVVRVQDVAEVRQTFRDATSFARIDGQPGIAIDITKTTGANVLDTVAAVRAAVQAERGGWPAQIQLSFMQDQGEDIATMLSDLENNVIAAVLLVMLATILALGLRAALLVAVAIPGAFLGGIMAISLMGFTLNVVVLFALILVIGMLVDGAIVVVELAERHRAEGRPRRDAFRAAAQRMAWPITASTATTLAVFVPLLFWPGVAGQFMGYLPATVIVTMAAALAMALVFVPVTGALFPAGRASLAAQDAATYPRGYARALDGLIARPGLAVGLALLGLVAAFATYDRLGRGVEFFPATDTDRAQIRIIADGNLSVHEADRLVRRVEAEVIGLDGVARSYARTIGTVEARLAANLAPDVIGTIQVDFTDWRLRGPSGGIIDEIRARTADLPGIGVQVTEQAMGPGAARPIDLRISADDRAQLPVAAARLRAVMEAQGTLVDVASDVPSPGIEMRLSVDRAQAARYGADIETLGTYVRLLTRGITLGSYLPDFAADEVDITLRYPIEARNFAELAGLRIATEAGQVPIANFVELSGAPAPAVINRVDGRNVQSLSAGIVEGTTATAEIARLGAALAEIDLPDGVDIAFAGEIEEQQEAIEFLAGAFVLALFLMFLILLTQLNSFFQSVLVLSAIIFSLAGVLLALVIRQEPFSVVMSGIGVIALAGVVVNNNIVLIDSYNVLRRDGLDAAAAARRAGRERFRPVLLTAVTTIAGLMPMVLGLTVDFTGRDFYIGAPSGQLWVQLATAMVGGLAVATFVTVFLTPSMLAWDGQRRVRRAKTAGAAA